MTTETNTTTDTPTATDSDETLLDQLAAAISYIGDPDSPNKFTDIEPGDTLTANIIALTPEGQVLARDALEAWSTVSGIHFELVEEHLNVDIIYDDESRGAYAITGIRGWGVGLSRSQININKELNQSDQVFWLYLHETGHALGLNHPGRYRQVAPEAHAGFANESWQTSVMSYISQNKNRDIDDSAAFPVTPQIADIIAIQMMYGQPAGANTGDTVYGVGANTGTYLDEFFAQWTLNESRSLSTLTIYDTGGYDTLDLSTDTFDQNVDLNPEGISDVYDLDGNLIIARDTFIERYVAGLGDDRVIGNMADNTLEGRAGDDELSGMAGNDALIGGPGADTLDGGDGADSALYTGSDAAVMVNLADGTATGGDADGDSLISIENLTGSAYADTLTGDNGINYLYGGDGDDELRGNSGDDVLEGGAGADQLDGGDGLDWVSYLGSDTAVTVNLEGGMLEGSHTQGDVFIDIENVRGSSYEDTLVGDEGANGLDGAGGDDELRGNAGDDELHGGSGDDTLEGGVGADRLDGGAGLDWVSYAGSDGAVSVRLYDGLAQRGHAEGDTITGFENLRGSAHPDRLAGTGRANHLEGGAGNDQIRGGSGDDVLEGGAGADRLYGGNGADTASYTGSDAGVVVRLHNLSARGGHAEGDTFENTLGVTYTSTDGTTQTENLPDIENLTGSDHNDILAGDRRDNRLYGAAGDDILYGGPGGGDDLMDGGAGADKLYGGQGDDRLTGGAGADQLRGGAGQDWVSYEGSDSAVTVKLLEGVVEGGHAQGDLVIDIESVIGSDYSDILGGDNNANHLHGRAGDDELRGGDGDDVLDGGAGADQLNGGSGMDWVIYQGSDAGVAVNLVNNSAEGGHAEGDIIDGFENVGGSGYQDVLIGDDSANHLDGKDGDDELRGNGGDDMLEGGAGADNLDGGTGDDLLSGGSGADLLHGGTGADQLNGGSGVDWITYQGSDTGVTVNLADNTAEGGHAQGDVITEIENVIGTGYGDILVGNNADNQLSGYDGDDELQGKEGNDSLDGGNGADRLYGGDGDDELRGGSGADVLDGGDGVDWVSYQGSDRGVWVRLDSGRGGFGHADRDVLVDIENIIGSDHNDTLKGDEGSNHLIGGGGDDKLWSSSGNDIMDGGDGDDRVNYYSSPAAVTVNLETGLGEGGHAEGDIYIDIERVTGSDFGDILIGDDSFNRLTGGKGDDEIHGNDRTDRLEGGDGADKLWGGDGADQLVGGDGADQLVGGDGRDLIYYLDSPVGVTVNLETGMGKGGYAEGDVLISIEDVGGSNHGDILIGNDSDNELDGNDGDDELHGNGGVDILRGREGADKLWGGDGNDSLSGNDGDDILHGGAGDDDLLGFEGNDIFVFGPGDGNDRIRYFIDNEDRIDLSAFGLTGIDDLTLLSESYGVIVDMSAHDGGTIFLPDIDIADIDASDFIF